jgi:hypothetical protein
MYRVMVVPARSAAGGVGTHDLAAGESPPLSTTPPGLIPLAEGAAAIGPDGAGPRPGEARAR